MHSNEKTIMCIVLPHSCPKSYLWIYISNITKTAITMLLFQKQYINKHWEKILWWCWTLSAESFQNLWVLAHCCLTPQVIIKEFNSLSVFSWHWTTRRQRKVKLFDLTICPCSLLQFSAHRVPLNTNNTRAHTGWDFIPSVKHFAFR